MPFRPDRARRFTAFSCALAVTLAAPLPTSVAYAAKAVPDPCATLRKPFTDIRDYQLSRVLGGVLAGILVGLIAKGVNDATDGRRSSGNVLPWIAGGAVAGGVAGYVSSKPEASRSKAELQAAITQDFTRDVAQFSPLPAQLAALGNCRREQIYAVQQQIEAKQVDVATSEAQLKQIEAWIAKDDQIIRKAAGQQGKTVTSYAQAMAMADGVDPATAQQDGWAVRELGGAGSDTIDVDVFAAELRQSTTAAATSVPPPPAATAKPAVAKAPARPTSGVRRVRVTSASKPAATMVQGAAQTNRSFAAVRVADRQATLDQLRAARAALTI